MTWWVIGATIVNAGVGAYGANEAGKAGKKSAEQNAALARQNLAVQLGLIEPARALGYGAQHDLAWIERAQEKGWDVLLDAAAFAPTNRLDLAAVHTQKKWCKRDFRH